MLEVDIDETQVIGVGGPLHSGILFHLRLDLSYPFREPGRALELQELRCQLGTDSGYVAAPVSVRCTQRVHQEYADSKNNLVHVMVPIDLVRLGAMDRARNGGDMSLKLYIDAFAVEMVEVGRTPGSYPQAVWGIKDTHRLTLQAPVVVQRSQWVERVLPQTGFGSVHLVELPVVPISQCARLAKSFEALKKAERLQREAFSNEAVGMCRIALEPFFEPADASNPSGPKKLKASWQTRLGAATYAWLNSSLAAVKGATNKSHHEPGEHFGSAEASMLLTVTTALIAYAARVEADTDPSISGS